MSRMTQITHDRTTKYVTAVREALEESGHATNAELLDTLKQTYPQLSATTIHRITSRLLERGEVVLAPSGTSNVLRFDHNNSPHDHFMCTHCGLLRDTILDDSVRRDIEKLVGEGCEISGSLTVSGTCYNCKVKGR